MRQRKEKINFYEVDIDRFININFDKTSREFSEILNSKENLVNYIKDIFNSTYKVTRVNDYSEKSEKIPYEVYNFRQVLVKAKEYLIIGNLQGAVEILKLSNRKLKIPFCRFQTLFQKNILYDTYSYI